jgi:opacity protein-like surface antigen
MKNIITAAALILVASAASAASLPEKKTAPAVPSPAVTMPESWYVGVNAGGNVRSDQKIQDTPRTFGGVVGYNFQKNIAIEGTLDYAFPMHKNPTSTRVMVNGVYSPFQEVYGFTPYALAGVGVQTHDVRDGVDAAKAVYGFGGGVKYAISKNIDVDTRYRYISTIKTKDGFDTNILSLGVNYKF